MDIIKKTILVIDDDASLAELVSEILESVGYHSFTVRSASEAIDWLLINSTFLVILDFGLPDMNGKELLNELSVKGIPLPPFIVCTGHGDERVAVEMMKRGARDYIVKDGFFLDILPLIISSVASSIENENKLRLTEQALIESAQFNRQIIEGVHEGIIVFGLNAIIKVWNPFMEVLSGLKSSEVVDHNPIEFLPFIMNSSLIEKVHQTFIEKSTYEIEHPFDFPESGNSGWFSDTIAPLINAIGEVIGAIVTVRDITERKISEKNIRESEHRYRQLVETANEGVLVTQDGYPKFVNSMMLHILGFSREELFAYPLSALVYPDDNVHFSNNSLELPEGKTESLGFQFRLIDKEGVLKWMDMNSVRILWDEKPATLHLITDITERRIAEIGRQKINERLSLACRAGGIGIWELDLLNNNLIWDEQMYKLYDIKQDTQVKTYESWRSCVFPDDLKRSEKELQMAISGQKDFNTEFRVVWTDGSIHTIRALAILQKDLLGNASSLIGTNYDITEVKQMESEIRFKNNALLKLNAEKDKFFSIIAHDLRSPISGFLGLTEIMSNDIQVLTIEEIKKLSMNMKISADSLFRLLDNLLQWSRMQEGAIPFQPTSIELDPLIKECLSIFQITAMNKELKVNFEKSGNFRVFADAEMIKTTFRNLLSNAMKFTPKGGSIRIISEEFDDNSIRTSIIDTGIGMNQEMVQNLFRLDVKTNRGGTEGEPSSGLGLLLCKEFIEKNDGRISVLSEVGKGSCFSFTLPCGKTM